MLAMSNAVQNGMDLKEAAVNRLIPLALLAMLPAFVVAAPTVGDRPPEIRLDKLLPEQPVANARFGALAGKVVVLEMWATWCGACVDAIPHLNELADHFKNRPVVFLSVTDEEPAVVASFLKKRPIQGWIGIAHMQSPLSAYGVDGIPATFLIDASGRIAGNTDPDMLSESMVEDLIAGRPLPPVALSIQPWRSNNAYLRSGRNSLDWHGVSVRSILSSLWEIPHSQITGSALDDRKSYDVSLSIPVAPPAEFRSRARDVLASAFHIKVQRETRETDVWILAKTETKPAALNPPGTISDLNNLGIFPATPPAAGYLFKLANAEVSFIAEMLGSIVNAPVIDETGITGKYDLRVPLDKNDAPAAIEAMRKAGFKMEAGRRTIEFLVATKTP